MALVVVVAIVVVAGLFFAGVFNRNGSPVHGPVSFATARATSDSVARNYGGGGWSLVIAGGIEAREAISLPVNLSVLGFNSTANCTFTYAPGAISTTITAPAFGGTFGSGESPSWFFVYSDASAQALVSVVLNNTGEVLGTISGACTGNIGLFGAIPSGVVDSTAAAGTAGSSGAEQFLAAHPTAEVSMVLIGGISILGITGPPTWFMGYSTCPFTNASATVNGSTFVAKINAQSGGLSNASNRTGSCASAFSLSSSAVAVSVLHSGAIAARVPVPISRRAT